MSITIDNQLCIGCRKCGIVCPGSLIGMDGNMKAYIKYPKDCWGCTSCLKECPVKAISFYLGADIGGRGSRMKVEVEKEHVIWAIDKPDGSKHTIHINSKSSNQY